MALRHVHIFILIYCMGDQERFHGAATGPYPSCPCYGRSCDFSRICSPTLNCSRENVALGKAASMSSYYSDSGPACLAVNGYTGTTYTATNHRQIPTCIHTGTGDRNMWWAVDLGQSYTVMDITVYIRYDEPQRMDNVRITVDGKECYTFPPGTTRTPSVKSVSCNSPVQGSFVRLTRNIYDDYLNFCQVEIWVCKPGLYGRVCDNHCNCKNNAVCDNYYGSCPAGCETGYYGFNCTQKCGNCKFNNACESINGYCLDGCQTGWKEPMCKECKRGYYGANCNQTCGKCKHSLFCSTSDGFCPDGCEDGYEKPFCKETCRNNTYGQNCIMQCGRCSRSFHCDAFTGACTLCESNFKSPMCTECISGYYGTNCEIQCGNCKGGLICNNSSGVCPDGCEDGYKIPLCKQECPAGTWGRNCKNTCGSCLGQTCHHDNGNCDNGCLSGYEGEHCTECISGYYGTNCDIQCGNCKDGMICNNTSGVCPDGCEDGYKFPLCKQKCPAGTWGRNCKNTCGACLGQTCRHDNGNCENGCLSGYEGEHCAGHTDSPDLTGVIVGSVFGSVLLLGCIIVIAVIIWRWRH